MPGDTNDYGDDMPETGSFGSGPLAKGQVIGHYRLLQYIAGGGQGDVWLAEQTQSINRRVAIKVLKNRNLNSNLTARFEAERQALAMMDHENIAKIYEVGLDELYGPFFAMEFCKGLPITKYCDTRRLSIKSRLDLFLQVCQAIQHAHQKGIIHRDIKPSNVLVVESDQRPVVKVIDFGLAKPTQHQLRLTDKSLFTEVGQLIGTFKYMSPEQAAANPIDIDTRSDIYSLGVLLYEMLTGSTPLDDHSLKEKALVEVLRLIREGDPPLPSRRLSDSNESLKAISSSRQTDSQRLPQVVRGDLDWIVMKTLEKERSRRYESANGLAMDVKRYLAGEPVIAAPPSRVYKLRKFLRRNQLTVTIATAFVLLLLAGIVGTSIGMNNSKRAERLAKDRLLETEAARAAESEQRILATRNAAEAEVQRAEALRHEQVANDKLELSESVIEFLLDDLLGQAGAEAQAERGQTPNPQLTVREALARAAEEVGTKFQDRPVIEARIRDLIGETYRVLGEYDKAVEFLEQSEKLFQKHVGEKDNQYLAAVSRLAIAYGDAGQLAKCSEMLEKAVLLSTEVLGPEHEDTLTNLSNLAVLYSMQGNLKKSCEVGESVRKIQTAKLGESHLETLTTMNNLAVGYGMQGEYEKAIGILETVLEHQMVKPGPDSPTTLNTLRNLAMGYQQMGRVDESIEMLQRVLERQQATMGPDHGAVAVTLNRLSQVFQTKKEIPKAREFGKMALEVQQKHMAENHPDVLLSRMNLASLEEASGNAETALKMLQEVLPVQIEVLGESHHHVHSTMRNLANLHYELKQYDEAIAMLERVIALMKIDSLQPWQIFHAHVRLGQAQLAVDRLEPAGENLLIGHAGLVEHKSTIPHDSLPILAVSVDLLIEVNQRLNRIDEIKKWQGVRAEIDR